jgi:hypothetical protein
MIVTASRRTDIETLHLRILCTPPVILRVAKRSRKIQTPHGSCGIKQDDKR